MIYRDISAEKYMTLTMVTLQTDILAHEVHTDRIHLYEDGQLLIDWAYCWDGASGPTIDSPTSMKGSLGHDALYHLMRVGKLPQSCKDLADKFLYVQCQKDGMNPVRALMWYHAVQAFGGASCRPGTQDDKIREAV